MLKRIEYFYFFFWFIAICVLWSRMFYFDGTDYLTQSKDIWADWTTHIPHVQNFAYRPFPLPYNSQFFGEPFKYHFAANALSGMLMKMGFSLVQALVIPSIICMELLVIAIYIFFLHMYQNKITAIISSLIFLFNGGIGVFVFIYYQLFHSSQISSLFTSSSILTWVDALGIRWANFFIADFIPQRALLLGAPITIFILTVLWNIYTNGVSSFSNKKLFAIGIISGLLPIIHFQSFFVVALTTLYVFVLSIYKNKARIRRWLWLFIPMGVIAAFFFSTIFKTLPTSTIRFEIGSIRQSLTSMPIVLFWIVNLGIMSILIPLAFMYAGKKYQIFYIPFLFLFIACNLLSFQKDPWDNRKFLLYWYLVSSGLVGSYLYRLIVTKGRLVTFILFYLITVSGFIDVVGKLNPYKQAFRLFSEQDVDFAKTIRSKTHVNDVFLTAPTNTLITLTIGRQTVMSGYIPWLKNYGYTTEQRMKDISDMYMGQESKLSLIDKYSIDYIVVGPTERSMYRVNETWLQQNATVLLKNDTSVIYDVRGVMLEGPDANGI